MANEQLMRGIDLEMCEQLRLATEYTTKHTVQLRTLRQVTDYMDLSWSTLPDPKTTIMLTPFIREKIRTCWYSQSSTVESNDEMEKVLAKDYVKPTEMIRIVLQLSRRESKQTIPTMQKVSNIVAADGFMGNNDMKRYVEYMKFASQHDFRGIHVRAVYDLYDGVSDPDRINHILNTAYGWSTCESEQDEEWKNFYINAVGNHLDSIMEWKRHQLQEEEKRKEVQNNKRKIESDEQPQESTRKKPRKSKNPKRIKPSLSNQEEEEENSHESMSSNDSVSSEEDGKPVIV